MRMITHDDVVSVALYLLTVSPKLRGETVNGLMQHAHFADKFRKRFRKPHNIWGDGTLRRAVPLPNLPSEPTLGSPEYCSCLSLTLDAVVIWRLRSLA